MNAQNAPSSNAGRTLTTLTYFASLAVIGLIYGATAPTLQALATQTGVGLGAIGAILSARSLGYLIGASQLGRLIDRKGCHRVMAAILIGCAVLLSLVPAAHSLWSLALLVGLIGFTLAGPDVGGNTLMLRLRGDRPGPYMNALHLFFGLGALIAPLLVAATRSEASIAAPYRWLALVVAVIGVAFFFRPEPEVSVQTSEAAEEPGVRRLLFLACIPFALYVGAEVGFSSWIFEFARATGTEGTATPITTTFWVAFTAFRFIGVLVALRVPPFRVMSISLAIGVMASCILFASSASPTFLWLGTLVLGAGIAAIYPTFILLLGERMRMTGRRLGMVAVASTLGSMSFPWIIGRAFTAWNPYAVPLVVGADLLVALVLVVILFHPHRHGNASREASRIGA